MPAQRFRPDQIMAAQACTGCRYCVDVCPAVTASGDSRLSGLYRLTSFIRAQKAQHGILKHLYRRKPGLEDWSGFAETVYRCTLCGNCEEVCPSGIGLRELWLDLRQDLVDRKAYPAKIDRIAENLISSHNVFDEDQEDRIEWTEDLSDDDDLEDRLFRDQAEVVYFTGCVASYFPMAQKIPLALVETIEAAKVNFTLLGADEWCCGFPLLGAGMGDQFKEIVEHNVEAVRQKKAKEIVFACPSCYMMWREHYPRESKLTHTTEFLLRLIQEKRLNLRPLDMTVTYHDPCDLGRGAGEYDNPREVIRSLPGVRLVEMAHSGPDCRCCGGGGNLEMIDPKLAGDIASAKIQEVMDTGASAVITACQQCVRTMATFARRNKINLNVLDISQFVRQALLKGNEGD